MSLHPHSDLLRLTPTLIYTAPDLLLFCHPDMFNKYCLAGTGYTRGVVVGLHRRWWIRCDSSFILINILKHPYTFLHSKNTHSYTDTQPGANTAFLKDKHLFIFISAAFYLQELFVLGFFFFCFLVTSFLTRRPDRLSAGRDPTSEVSSFNHSAQKQQNTPL